MLPDAFLIRIADPGLEARRHAARSQIGAEVEIQLAGATGEAAQRASSRARSRRSSRSSAPARAILAARGYDHSHALHRSAADADLPEHDRGRHRAQGRPARRPAARARSRTAAACTTSSSRARRPTGLPLAARGARSTSRSWSPTGSCTSAGPAAPRDAAVPLRWGENLLAFRPRVTGVQQVDDVVVRGWDPTRNAAIEATRRRPARATRRTASAKRARSSRRSAAARVTVGDRAGDLPAGGRRARQERRRAASPTRRSRRRARARATRGCSAGSQDRGRGRRHALRRHLHALVDHARRPRRAGLPHPLHDLRARAAQRSLDLMTPGARARLGGQSLAVGVVTQNDDPEKLGRVRVKYPALGDDTEGWWARVAAPAARREPRPADAARCPATRSWSASSTATSRRPYVLGSLWNGVAAARASSRRPDGSLRLRSDHKRDRGREGGHRRQRARTARSRSARRASSRSPATPT